MKSFILVLLFLFFCTSCKKKEDTKTTEISNTPTGPAVSECPTCTFPDTVWVENAAGPKLIFKFNFDSTQARLNNSGMPKIVPNGNAAQSPRINGISAHYIEMAQDNFTQAGKGAVLYSVQETTCGGSNAVIFCKQVICKNGDVFFSMPLSRVPSGSYKWLRVSVAYQNFDIRIKTNSTGAIDATLASFDAYATYLSKYKVKNTVTSVSPYAINRSQGYWGFYTKVFTTDIRMEGMAPEYTVVNPNPDSPVPAGHSFITGEFYNTAASSLQPLVINGNETQDIIITVSLSTNKSFEWMEKNFDGLFQPDASETIVDMGIRGMIPKY